MRLNEHNQTLMYENKVEQSEKLFDFKEAWIILDSNIHRVRSLAQQSYNYYKKIKNQVKSRSLLTHLNKDESVVMSHAADVTCLILIMLIHI